MHALIIGGGVAGPAAAVALRTAGLDATVLERHVAVDDAAGAFLVVAPNGLAALQSLKLEQTVAEAHGMPLGGIRFVNDAGRQIARLNGERDRHLYGASSHLMRRGALHKALTEAAGEAGADVVYGARVIGVEETNDGVEVRLHDGRRLSADLVLGADGVRSVVREALFVGAAAGRSVASGSFSAAPQPRYTGIVDCGGWAPVDLPDTSDQVMVFGDRAFFGYVIRNGIAYWFTNVAEPADTGADPRVGPGTGSGGPGWLARIRELHRKAPHPVPQILQAADNHVRRWPIYDVPHLPTWHTARICLLGDAAHATSPSAGQGASLALEDAALLGRCLGELNPPQAFAAFERLRKPRAESVVELGRRLGDSKTPTGVPKWLRNLLLPVFLRVGARQTTGLYRYRIEDHVVSGADERVP